jgi:hypothetical protein
MRKLIAILFYVTSVLVEILAIKTQNYVNGFAALGLVFAGTVWLGGALTKPTPPPHSPSDETG